MVFAGKFDATVTHKKNITKTHTHTYTEKRALTLKQMPPLHQKNFFGI